MANTSRKDGLFLAITQLDETDTFSLAVLPEACVSRGRDARILRTGPVGKCEVRGYGIDPVHIIGQLRGANTSLILLLGSNQRVHIDISNCYANTLSMLIIKSGKEN